MNFALGGIRQRVVIAAMVSMGLMAAGTDLALHATAAPASKSGTKIALRHSSVGKVLDGASKKFAYVHVTSAGKDAPCTTVCQVVWPMATTHGKPRAGSGVKKSKLGQTSSHQVTYRHHRLYYYAFGPQSTSGDGAKSFGGTWKLMNAKGKLK